MSVSLVVLIAMAATVLILAAYRKVVARNEDDLVHLADGADSLIANQRKTEHSLTLIDRAGKILTVATVVYGLALVANFLYTGLTAPSL
jgi:hypothetical protein